MEPNLVGAQAAIVRFDAVRFAIRPWVGSGVATAAVRLALMAFEVGSIGLRPLAELGLRRVRQAYEGVTTSREASAAAESLIGTRWLSVAVLGLASKAGALEWSDEHWDVGDPVLPKGSSLPGLDEYSGRATSQKLYYLAKARVEISRRLLSLEWRGRYPALRELFDATPVGLSRSPEELAGANLPASVRRALYALDQLDVHFFVFGLLLEGEIRDSPELRRALASEIDACTNLALGLFLGLPCLEEWVAKHPVPESVEVLDLHDEIRRWKEFESRTCRLGDQDLVDING